MAGPIREFIQQARGGRNCQAPSPAPAASYAPSASSWPTCPPVNFSQPQPCVPGTQMAPLAVSVSSASNVLEKDPQAHATSTSKSQELVDAVYAGGKRDEKIAEAAGMHRAQKAFTDAEAAKRPAEELADLKLKTVREAVTPLTGNNASDLQDRRQYVRVPTTDVQGKQTFTWSQFATSDSGALLVKEVKETDGKKELAWVPVEKSTAHKDVQRLHMDHVGVLRDEKGVVLGKIGIDPAHADELKVRVATEDGKPMGLQGVFLQFASNQTQVAFYPVVGKGSDGQPIFGQNMALDVNELMGTQTISGSIKTLIPALAGRHLIQLGTPPGVDANGGFVKSHGEARAGIVARTREGKSEDANVTVVENGFVPGSVESNELERMKQLSELISGREGHHMASHDTIKATGNADTVKQRPEIAAKQRFETLTFLDPQTGQASTRYVGTTTSGNLVVYNANGTAENNFSGPVWTAMEGQKNPVQHVFLRSDFSLVTKDGKTIGTVDPKSLTKEDLTLKEEGIETKGMFLKKGVKIILTDGKIVDYDPASLGLGKDSKAMIQIGDPSGDNGLKQVNDKIDVKDAGTETTAGWKQGRDRQFLFEMEVARAGGFVDAKSAGFDGPLKGQKDDSLVLVTRDGSIRMTFDFGKDGLSKVKRLMVDIPAEIAKLDPAKDSIEILALTKERQKLLLGNTFTQEPDPKNVGLIHQTHISVQRRTHLVARDFNPGSSQPIMNAVWVENPAVEYKFGDALKTFGKALGGSAAPADERTRN